MKRLLGTFIIAFGLGATPVLAAGGGDATIEDHSFSFEGPFGSWDQAQLQRGLQVYTEICSGCHGLQYVPFRALEDLGYSDAEVRAFAAQFYVPDDSPDAQPGDEREATPTDYFPMSLIENAPDLSLMAKARAGFHGPYGLGINQLLKGMGGPEYIYSLMLGYTGNDREEAGIILYENTAYEGGYFAMPQPLWGDDVEYADGTPATIEQTSADVSAFLMWAAEPTLIERKSAGLTAFLFLGILAVLLYLTNQKIWRPIKHPNRQEPAE